MVSRGSLSRPGFSAPLRSEGIELCPPSSIPSRADSVMWWYANNTVKRERRARVENVLGIGVGRDPAAKGWHLTYLSPGVNWRPAGLPSVHGPPSPAISSELPPKAQGQKCAREGVVSRSFPSPKVPAKLERVPRAGAMSGAPGRGRRADLSAPGGPQVLGERGMLKTRPFLHSSAFQFSILTEM